MIHRFAIRIANELVALRAAPRARNERSFDVHAGNLFDRAGGVSHRTQHIDNFRNRRRDSGQEQRRRATAGVIVADRLKRFRRRLHRVAAERAVDVKIDESRREIVPAQIDRFPIRSLANRGDFPLLHDHLQTVANSIREE